MMWKRWFDIINKVKYAQSFKWSENKLQDFLPLGFVLKACGDELFVVHLFLNVSVINSGACSKKFEVELGSDRHVHVQFRSHSQSNQWGVFFQ